jgi:hypothetical protein
MSDYDFEEFESYSDPPYPKWYPTEPTNWGKYVLFFLIACFIFVAPVPVIVILALWWIREALRRPG